MRRDLAGSFAAFSCSSAALFDLILEIDKCRSHCCPWQGSAFQPPESSVLPGLDKETENSFFTEGFGGFQPMQAFNEHEPSAVRPYSDRRLLALVEHARGDFVYALLIKGSTPLDWHVDVSDRDGLAFQHAGFTSSIGGTF
jgi:hypothetical protein